MSNKKKFKKSGVFHTPEELQDCFVATRIIIHSHVYENIPRYEDIIGALIATLMTEFHEFKKIGIDPMDFVRTEEDDVARNNIMAIIKDVNDKIELQEKLEGKNGTSTDKRDKAE